MRDKKDFRAFVKMQKYREILGRSLFDDLW